ncbi:hypothetical protein [Lysobacter gummosus]|uniref:hypothetical protein n=1 Tax=Lysobacter gummosus TaxID=262324 RepID=UPI0036435D44
MRRYNRVCGVRVRRDGRGLVGNAVRFKKPGTARGGNRELCAPVRVGKRNGRCSRRTAGPCTAIRDQAKRKRGWTQLLV